MKRIIDFLILVNGEGITKRIEYESKYKSLEEIKSTKYPEVFNVMHEAESALKKEMGDRDYLIQYWDWVV